MCYIIRIKIDELEHRILLSNVSMNRALYCVLAELEPQESGSGWSNLSA